MIMLEKGNSVNIMYDVCGAHTLELFNTSPSISILCTLHRLLFEGANIKDSLSMSYSELEENRLILPILNGIFLSQALHNSKRIQNAHHNKSK